MGPTTPARPAEASRVLCVDDDDDMRDMVAACLSRAGFSVSTAATIRDANRALDESVFDIVVTDYQLPDGDGSSFIEAALALGKLNGARVVMITGSYMARRLTDVALWVKPVDPSTLVARIHALLQKPRPSSSAT